MNAAIVNKKTIVIWDRLLPSQSEDLLRTLSSMLSIYSANLPKNNGNEYPIPFALNTPGEYITAIHKNGVAMLFTAKHSEEFYGVPVINGDELYRSIEQLKATYVRTIHKRTKLYRQYSNSQWIQIKFNKDIESFLLSPNPNPEDFIEKLKKDSLPEMYRKFLDDVGVALKSPETVNINIDIDIDRQDV